MEEIKIGSINTKDNKINRNGGIREDGGNNSIIVANNISKEQFDILGTQELTRNFVNSITEHLTTYKFYGDYRYGDGLISKLPFFKEWNENNNIITNRDVISTETVQLPWIPTNPKDLKESIVKASIMPRIATIVLSKANDGEVVCSINTHLDYQISSVQKRQLHFLYNLVSKYVQRYPVTLTGDFNMEIKNPLMNDFKNSIENLGLQRAEINDQTQHEYETAIDHIFIPKNWDITDAGIVNDEKLSKVTDHKEIYTVARKK